MAQQERTLAEQAQGPKFGSPAPWKAGSVACNPKAEGTQNQKTETGWHWGLLAGQLSHKNCKTHAQRDPDSTAYGEELPTIVYASVRVRAHTHTPKRNTSKDMGQKEGILSN